MKMKKANKFEYSEEEVKEAIDFVIKDNPNRTWKSKKELLEAVDNYLAESTVTFHLEECIKLGLVEEIAPNRFVPTKKGLELAKENEKNSK
jgi:hypothetical protein